MTEEARTGDENLAEMPEVPSEDPSPNPEPAAEAPESIQADEAPEATEAPDTAETTETPEMTDTAEAPEAAAPQEAETLVAEVVPEATEEVAGETAEGPVAEAVEETVEEAVAEVAEEAPAEAVTEAVSEPAAEAVAQEPEAAASQEAEPESTPETSAEPAPEPVAQTEPAPEPAPAPVAEAESEAEAASAPQPAAGQTAAQKRKVRKLSVGQKLTGTVKRTTEFGAFIDIGAGRDGLVHISELSLGRVAKVTDVVQKGQEVTVWIKKLDRARNRISLTMIDPNTKTIRDLQEGEVLEGTVTRIVPFGAFVDIGVGVDGLLHIREMSSGYVAKVEDVVKQGEKIQVRIKSVNRRRRRIDLTLKGLRDEPEAEASQDAFEEEEFVDELEDVEVLSPMELAFKRAMEAEGIELKPEKSRKKKRRKKARRHIQEEIIARTLETVQK